MLACSSAFGATEATPQTQAAIEVLTRANAAVVGVQVTAEHRRWLVLEFQCDDFEELD